MYSSTVTQFEEPAGKKTPEELAAETVYLPPEAAKQPLIYRNIIAIAILHFVAFYSLITRWHEASIWTWIFGPTYGIVSGLGYTAGAHRLWAHRSYSAKAPLRILLGIMYCAGGQTSPNKWIRDHRTHHRFTETPADPHDSNRGFFFSHIGWLMMRRHPAVKRNGSKVDMSDILADPILQFFNKFYPPIMLSLCFVVPSIIPVYFWNEQWSISILAVIIRYVGLINITFCVNSFAHMVGNRPYNKNVKATENPIVAYLALGEGWHNYHHSFPWDYKAAEWGGYGYNLTTSFIDAMAWLGLAYNLKTPSKEIVDKMSQNKGDGTMSRYGIPHQHHHHHHDH